MRNIKSTSLRGAILRIMAMTVIVIVMLLFLLDGYMIQSYRDATKAEWKATLSRYTDGIKSDLDEINSDLYDIYNYDSNYEKLKTVKGVEALPCAYALEDRLQTQLLLKRRASGYVLFFDDMQKKRYFFGRESFSNAELEELKQQAEQLSSTDEVLRDWFYIVVQEKEYGIGIYRNGGISLSVVYSLDNSIKELEDELKNTGAEVFIEHNGKVLGSGKRSAEFESALEYQDEIRDGVYYYEIPVRRTDLSLHLAIPVNMWTFVNTQQMMVIVITLVVFLISLLFYRHLNKDLFRPMDDMIEDMRRIGGGDWSSGIHTSSRYKEVQQVIETTDRMIDEIESQKLLAYEKTIQEQKARMQYLSLQLNPHFYLNGLKTLNFLAIKGDNEKIQEIIILLSSYLRYLLQREDEMVTLEQEIAFTKSYVHLYQTMTDRRIIVDWRISRETTDCMIPRLCIQTFVENSFKYAKVGNVDIPLSLLISAGRFISEDKAYLEILIRDNGEGYKEELLTVLNEAPTEGGYSVGINNLKRRCGFLYKEEVQFAFYNDGGAVSDAFFPWIIRQSADERGRQD